MDERIYKITKEYFDEAESVKTILLSGLGLNSKEELICFKGRMPTGTFYLQDYTKNDFYFHGRGLRFHRENMPSSKNHIKELDIDMEIGYGDFWCGISYWMLYKYIEQYYPELAVEFNDNRIKEELEKGVQQNKLYKKYDLYYFV